MKAFSPQTTHTHPFAPIVLRRIDVFFLSVESWTICLFLVVGLWKNFQSTSWSCKFFICHPLSDWSSGSGSFLECYRCALHQSSGGTRSIAMVMEVEIILSWIELHATAFFVVHIFGVDKWEAYFPAENVWIQGYVPSMSAFGNMGVRSASISVDKNNKKLENFVSSM